MQDVKGNSVLHFLVAFSLKSEGIENEIKKTLFENLLQN